MAERIDIIVQAAQGASPLARGGGQGVGGLPSAQGIGQVGQAAKEAKGGIEGMAQSVLGLQAALRGLAVVAIAQQLYGMGVAAGQAYLQLEKTENTARLLSGTTANYNALVDLARKNQILFGGSLADNIQGLTGFANMAKKSGIDLAEFNDLASRLNLLDPAQGMEGASIALKEAMSGDTQSLVERYELPRAALAKLRDANMSAADRVKFLSEMLTEQGVAAGAAASSVSDTAKAYNEFAASIDRVKTAFGGVVAKEFSGAALGVARILEGNWQEMILSLQQNLPNDPIIAGLAEQARASLDAASAAHEAASAGGQVAQVAQQAAAMLDLSKLAADAQGQALRGAAQAAIEARDAGGGLDAQSRAAAAALLGAGRAGADAAALLAGSTAQVDLMTAAQYRLQSAASATAAAMGARIQQEHGDDPATRAAKLRAQYEADLASQITRTTGSTAERLALVRQELATAPQYSDARKALLVQEAQLAKQLASEQAATAQQAAAKQESAATKAANLAKSAAEKAQREREQRQEEVNRAYERIEERTQDHYRRLRTAQEDYELSSSRKTEDYQIERQRLLAEGRIKEAQLLKEKFDLDQRRAAEDAARTRTRTTEDYSGDVAKIRKDAQLGGATPTAPTGAQAAPLPPRAPGLAAPDAPTLAAGGVGMLRLEFGTLQISLNDERVADVLFQSLAERLDAALAASIRIVGVVSPPGGGQGSGVSGSRP